MTVDNAKKQNILIIHNYYQIYSIILQLDCLIMEHLVSK